MIGRVGIACLLALCAGGCAIKGPASVAGGECKIFERPDYAVIGKRPYDQDWIDSQVEGGVGGCGWKRPSARPAALDAAPARNATPAPVRKPTVVQRIKARITGKPVAPVPYVVAPIVPAVAPARPAPPPRDAVDELLQPSEPVRQVYPR